MSVLHEKSPALQGCVIAGAYLAAEAPGELKMAISPPSAQRPEWPTPAVWVRRQLMPSQLQTGEDLPVSAQGAKAPATLCASQPADVMAPVTAPGAMARSSCSRTWMPCFHAPWRSRSQAAHAGNAAHFFITRQAHESQSASGFVAAGGCCLMAPALPGSGGLGPVSPGCHAVL